jgi:crotonobetainyl-CoA:carnitine CoA-transferase CaiB-like acyl-CoA transferase
LVKLLDGIHVVDFGRFIAAPYAAMMLADFGADVIRVERREGGEDRTLGPAVATGEGGWFLNINRNKRGMTLDLGHPAAGEIVTRLVRWADVVIVNLPIDVMRKLRLDYDAVRAVREDIILVMASAFGPDGPYRDRVGFDGVLQAMSGAMGLSGFESPTRSVVAWADYGTALHAAFGAMAALYHRARTGRGQLVDVSLLATGAMFMTPFLIERVVTGIRRTRQGNAGFHSAPSDAYRTSDGGWILVPTVGGPMFRRWARLVGREDLIDDPRFRDDINRANHSGIIAEVMTDWCAARTRDQAIAELERARVPCGPVYDLDELYGDPQVRARRLFEELEFPNSPKTIPIANPATRLSETPAEIRHRAPTLGEHTDEVLRELGFSNDEIAALHRQDVV